MSDIEFEGLHVRLGGRTVLNGLTGELRGKAIGLLGPNGAGKSTLINTLLGFHVPSQGSARVFGLDTQRDRARIRQGVGYMPENDSFIGNMTGVRFVRYMAELAGLPAGEALERAH
jgi:ABC-2 type transport system ATP-binding protein